MIKTPLMSVSDCMKRVPEIVPEPPKEGK